MVELPTKIPQYVLRIPFADMDAGKWTYRVYWAYGEPGSLGEQVPADTPIPLRDGVPVKVITLFDDVPV